jgi:hypothetical protein
MRQGVVMADIAIHNVRDLGPDARRALEVLLGRRLAEEEQVSVTALAARLGTLWRRAQNRGRAPSGKPPRDVGERANDPQRRTRISDR